MTIYNAHSTFTFSYVQEELEAMDNYIHSEVFTQRAVSIKQEFITAVNVNVVRIPYNHFRLNHYGPHFLLCTSYTFKTTYNTHASVFRTI